MMRNPLLRVGLLSTLTLLAACTTTQEPETPVKKTVETRFEAVEFSALPDIAPADWQAALEAFRTGCEPLGKRPNWRDVCRRARETGPQDAETFFRSNFTPWHVRVARLENGEEVSSDDTGLMTGYYEPLLHGSRVRQGPYVHPLYGVPDDLIQVDLDELYPQLKGLRLRGKIVGRRLVPYDTRGEIQERSDLERWAIAWVDDPVDAFFLHIQGSGRIRLPDGGFMRVGFADQNGYGYRSIGNWLIQKGHLKPHELSMQRIRRWAKEHPAQVKEALAQNPSYVFFEERKTDPTKGPVGAQGVPLTPMASVAVDPRHWRLGTPFVVSVSQESPSLHFTRPVVAQDTGGAIRGAIRFDYFWGFGDEAGASAGRQKSEARAWVLIPNGLRPEDAKE